MELSPVAVRVVGCLVEKQLTTPQQYPLSLAALVAACNQTSNRQPVVAYDERTVEAALASLKEQRLVRYLHPSHGRSVIRYRHVLDEALGLGREEVALLAALLLRGPQTGGELRARTERIAGLAGLEEVEAALERLAERDDPLVARLERAPGQKEQRYAHLLGADPGPAASVTGAAAAPGPATAWDAADAPGHRAASADALAGEVAALRAEVAALRREVDELRARAGP